MKQFRRSFELQIAFTEKRKEKKILSDMIFFT